MASIKRMLKIIEFKTTIIYEKVTPYFVFHSQLKLHEKFNRYHTLGAASATSGQIIN